MYELSNMQISTTFVHVKNWRKRSFFFFACDFFKGLYNLIN